MAKNELTIVSIADVHAGALHHKTWQEDMEEGPIKYMEENDFDLLNICGDYFDKKLSANSPHIKSAMYIMYRMLGIASAKGAKVRIIQGTDSHDNNQLDLFNGLDVLLDCDFKIIRKLSDEVLFPGFKMLYVPEEYINDPAYYAEYLDKEDEYDMVIGHGVTDMAVFVSKVQESEETHPHAPIIPVKELLHCSTGPVYFGHIHRRMWRDRFRYLGSYFTWAYGESTDKGFMITTYDTIERKITSEEYIHNPNIVPYDTWTYDVTHEIYKLSPTDVVSFMINESKRHKKGKVRFHMIIPEHYEEGVLLTKLMNDVFANHQKVKLKIENNTKIRQKKRDEERLVNLLAEYEILFNRSVTPLVKLSAFIAIKSGINIPVEKLEKYLTSTIQEAISHGKI